VVVAWMFVPAMQPAMPMFSSAPFSRESAVPDSKGAKPKYDLMDEELRRGRAEKLIGRTLTYARKDSVYDVAWSARQESDMIEQAMDECYLILDPTLYARHLIALGVIDQVGGDQATQDALAPTSAQRRNCVSVLRAYGRLNGTEFDF